MADPIKLSGFPKNRDEYLRLKEFFSQFLEVCEDVGARPVVDGSLAVFSYTGDGELEINDIDVGFPEGLFARTMAALSSRRLDYRLMDWQVLRVLKDDLRIELGSMEYWYTGLPMELETLQIDGREVDLLGLVSLTETYRRGMESKAQEAHESDGKRIKYEALKRKYKSLLRLR